MKDIEPGLNFAVENELTIRDMQIYLVVLNGSTTIDKISKNASCSRSFTQNILTRLKLKKVIVVEKGLDARFHIFKVA